MSSIDQPLLRVQTHGPETWVPRTPVLIQMGDTGNPLHGMVGIKEKNDGKKICVLLRGGERIVLIMPLLCCT